MIMQFAQKCSRTMYGVLAGALLVLGMVRGEEPHAYVSGGTASSEPGFFVRGWEATCFDSGLAAKSLPDTRQAKSSEQCQVACREDPLCAFGVFDAVRNYCKYWTFLAVCTFAPSSSTIIFGRPAKVLIERRGVNYPGGEWSMRIPGVPDKSQCATFCQITRRCNAAMFLQGESCVLKQLTDHGDIPREDWTSTAYVDAEHADVPVNRE